MLKTLGDDLTGLRTAIILGCIVFASRLPFIAAGYGSEPDAWRMILAARAIATTGAYSASRFPGYPIPEIAYSLFLGFGPIAFNGLTAFLSALATICFWLYVRLFAPKDAALTSLAFAFAPVIFVNSTSSKDYVWALLFVMAAWYLCSKECSWLAGVALGLGIGSRLTSAVMMIPLALTLFAARPASRATRHTAMFVVATASTAAIAFLPVWLTYGLGFLTFSDHSRYPDILLVIQRATEGVWGRLGLLGIVLAIAVRLLWPRLVPTDTPIQRPFSHLILSAWILTVSLYCIAFVRLPHQSGYLIPTVPFVLLALACLLPRSLYWGVCLLLVLSPFITVGRHGLQEGPIFLDQQARRGEMQYVAKLLQVIRGLPDAAVVVVGWHFPVIAVSATASAATDVDLTVLTRVVYLVDRPALDAFARSGTRIYYLDEVREFNKARYGIDLQMHGGVPLNVDTRTK
jgi:hypothetical protein